MEGHIAGRRARARQRTGLQAGTRGRRFALKFVIYVLLIAVAPF